MAGKATIPAFVHAEIQRMHSQGASRRAIAIELECSMYTVRKALDPDFIEQERERQRALWPARKVVRKDDENYIAYQEAYSKTPERREQAKQTMAKLRHSRKPATS